MLMLPTLRSLLATPELALTLLTPEGALSPDALDAPIEWVHSSDLTDPTPFLSRGHVLLSTGTQFEARPAAAAHSGSDSLDPHAAFSYVQRLQAVGVAGLGFGTEVVRAGTPEALVDACTRLGLPLFEVPYRTPFIAVARTAADMASEERFARRSWSLAAQRAIALAALRPDGLSASLEELSRQLGQWVALFNADGALDRAFPAHALDSASAVLDAVRGEAARLLQRGQRASSNLVAGTDTVTLQTLGRRDNLRGVLALGGASELDQASNEVITAVIALAGLALEQNHALNTGRSELRAGLLRALRQGNLELVRGVSSEIWGRLPAEPVQVAVLDAVPSQLDAIATHLEARVAESPGAPFFAVNDEQLVLLLSSRVMPTLEALSNRFAVGAGVSEPSDYAVVESAIEQAKQALEHQRGKGVGVSTFDEIARSGVLAFLSTTDAAPIGRAVVQPLRDYDASTGSELLHTLRLWLEQNGQFDATAQLLGVHRHTVRARVAQAEKLLERDLSGFRERAEIWAALLVSGDSAS